MPHRKNRFAALHIFAIACAAFPSLQAQHNTGDIRVGVDPVTKKNRANAVAEAMHSAGGPFFNQETTIDEAEITQPLPEGKVDIGESLEIAPEKK